MTSLLSPSVSSSRSLLAAVSCTKSDRSADDLGENLVRGFREYLGIIDISAGVNRLLHRPFSDTWMLESGLYPNGDLELGFPYHQHWLQTRF